MRNSSLTLKKYKKIKFEIAFSLLLSALLLVGCILVLNITNFISFIFSIIIPALVLTNILLLVYWFVRRKKYFFYHLSSLLVYLFCFESFLQLNRSHPNESKSITILSFNARGFNSNNDIKQIGISNEIVSFVKNEDPDVVCFQEFSRYEFNSFSYYPYRFIGYRENQAKSLQVIYSKFPIVNRGYIDFYNTRNGGIFVDLKYNNEVFRVYNMHLQSFQIKLQSKKIVSYGSLKTFNKISKIFKLQNEQAIEVANHSKSFKGKSVICGDFNSTQFSSAYNILKKGRSDSFIEKGNGLGATYRLFNYPLRLDFVLMDNGFETISHENFKLELSDHEPIMVELAVN